MPKELYTQLDQRTEILQKVQQQKLDSVRSYYDQKIDKLEKDHQAFQASISWQNKINISNPEIREIISRQQAELHQSRADKRAAITALTAHQSKVHTESKKEQNFSVYFWLGFTLVIESGILTLLWFSVYFLYRIQHEAELLTLNPKYFMDLPTLHKLFQQSLNQYEASLNPNLPSPFTTSSEQNAHNSEAEGEDQGEQIGDPIKQGINTAHFPNALHPYQYDELANYLEKHKDVVDALNAGMSYSQSSQKVRGIQKYRAECQTLPEEY